MGVWTPKTTVRVRCCCGAYAPSWPPGGPRPCSRLWQGHRRLARRGACGVRSRRYTPRAGSEQRWADTGAQLAALIQPGEEADLGAVLELAGLLDVHRHLDEREQQVRRLLERAFTAAGGLPSGYGVIRLLRTGRLTDAFVSIATHGSRRSRPMPPAYWTHLLAAAALLTGTDDDRFEPCVALCRRLLDQADTPMSQ
jgi:hypothetical protein